MTARSPFAAAATVAAMAAREAAALTLVPDLRVRTDGPDPEILFRPVDCPWCGAAAPCPPPMREIAFTGDRALPRLSLLACEEVTARSLLALTLIRSAEASAPPRFVTRGVFWARTVGTGPIEDLGSGLALLDAAERWFDDLLPAFRSGPPRRDDLPHLPYPPEPLDGAHWTHPGDAPLPVSVRAARPAPDGRRAGTVASSRRSLHFLSPHARGESAARLNHAYLSARADAVRAALTVRDHPALAV
ncbi:hypothetical protein [Actinomadura sp. NEAU-AAG7]|uniref:hypothetical protein n=1 Tax=Actinomadura sp. NEAU-AAG7 TaxID=2839640 RepID=UPI001BE470F0|nr:hypothetical protein [Actinomadura sp. NEAU-AAG7]MBT2210917.1 hypothetical protein [Actinomadura sp. NEAU-AAG7]